MSVSYELYLNFLYSDVLVCFPLFFGVTEFCMNKISMELCGFVCGFCNFSVTYLWVSLYFIYVGLSFCLCLYLDCVGFIQIFCTGMYPLINCA